jgi:LysM repeat protein
MHHLNTKGSEASMATMYAPTTHHGARARRAPVARVSSQRVTRAQLRVRRTVAVLVLLSAVLAGVFVLGRSTANSATQVPGQHPAAPVVYTVQPGDTLWSIATKVAPQTDPRTTVHLLRDLNSLSTGIVEAGQKLTIPN